MIDDIWKGRTRDCGTVQLAENVGNRLIFLQILAAMVFVQLLPLKPNDLYEWPPERIIDGQVLLSSSFTVQSEPVPCGQAHGLNCCNERPQVDVTPYEAFCDVFKIPLVKRQVFSFLSKSFDRSFTLICLML